MNIYDPDVKGSRFPTRKLEDYKSSWSTQLMLSEEPESADQTRFYKIFFLSDITALWALMSRVWKMTLRL